MDDLQRADTLSTVIEHGFLYEVLAPYKPHCRYLLDALIERAPSGSVTATGEFAIAESCYIADTGHFNAVEFIISYNQLAYVMFAHISRARLLPIGAGFDYERFKQAQLAQSLIVKMSNSFRKPINARRFFGKIDLKRASLQKGALFLDTRVSFSDEQGGAASGDVLLACIAEHAWGRKQSHFG